MPDRLREDELARRGYRERDYRREGDNERSRDFDERRFGERGYRDFGRGYGRDYGSERGRYGGIRGPSPEIYNPRSDYDRGPSPYDPEYGEGPLYGGGASYRREPGDFGRPYGYGRTYERDYARTPSAARRESGARNFRGRGPKGYVRSDERIHEDVCDRLADDPTLDPSNIEVRVDGGEVVLEGLVDTRDEKRRAEDIAESASGVRNVKNLLRYETAEGGRTTGTAPGMAGEAPETPARGRRRK